jgi:GYF domain 2
MELNYTVLGADGKEYGPVTLNQLSAWVREGRVPGQQQVRRSDMQHWAAANAFAELRELFGPVALAGAAAAPAAFAPAAPSPRSPIAAAHLRSGASWFYWIAGLSLVNSISSFAGLGFRFLFGLGITRLLDEAGASMGTSGQMIALVLNLMAAALFVLFGFFGHKGHLWAFLVGMILFALDGLIFVFAQMWLGVAFHAFALFCLFRGFAACRELRQG